MFDGSAIIKLIASQVKEFIIEVVCEAGTKFVFIEAKDSIELV